MEVDEVFTFVGLKVRQIRIWIVLCRQTRQIVSFFIGDGSMESCKRLWRKLPYAYLKCKSFSDFWKAYNCLPESTHQKVGKETGETAHVERLNNTIRQRFSRLVRRTLSYSKRAYMLNLHFKLWAYYYNLNTTSSSQYRINSIPYQLLSTITEKGSIGWRLLFVFFLRILPVVQCGARRVRAGQEWHRLRFARR